MRIIILVMLSSILTFSCYGLEEIVDRVSYYKGYKHSTVVWDELETKDYLSLDLWLDQRKQKDANLQHKREERDLLIRERLAYVLSCVGDCRIYRGLKHSHARHLSSLREGDDLETGADSYLWVYFLDGTLLRMAPESSVSLNEFNVGPSSLFLYARVNVGNVVWWSRQGREYKERNDKETDTLFLPLPLLKANLLDENLSLTRENFLKDNDRSLRKYQRLNQLIKKNKAIQTKKTTSFLVLPNATIVAKQFIGDVIVLNNGKSYIHKRSLKDIGLSDAIESEKAYAFYRGFNNKEKILLEEDVWFEVDRTGRRIEQAKNDSSLSLGQLPTKDIPTILTAREIWLKKLSSFIFSKRSKKFFSQAHGYRLWSDQEMQLRTSFLKEYTRRVETTNVNVREKRIERLKEQGSAIAVGNYDHRYYERAMTSYMKYREPILFAKPKQTLLNSEKKKFWDIIHGRY